MPQILLGVLYRKKNKSTNFSSYLSFPVIFSFLLSFAISGVVYTIIGSTQKDRDDSLNIIGENLRRTVLEKINGDRDYLNLLSEMRVRKELTTDNFEKRSKGYLENHTYLINYTWVDNDFYIRAVAPVAGNSQIIGLHLDLKEPARVSKLAQTTRLPQYTNAFEAIQGNSSFELWLPVFNNEEFLGTFAAVYSIEKLINLSIPDKIRSTFSVTAVNTEGAILAEFIDISKNPTGDSIVIDTGLNNIRFLLQRYEKDLFDSNLIFLVAATLLLGLLVILSVISLQREISRRKIIFEKLERAHEEISQFAYRSSHDLRAPLITIKNLAKYIVEDIDAGNTAEAKQNSDKVIDIAGKTENLCELILTLAKADLEDIAPETINFETILSDIENRISRLNQKSNVEISTNVNVRSEFRSYKVRIFQIIENLISNGVKYADHSKPENFVRADVVEEGAYIKVSVKDNGLGIPPENLGDVFSMFKRFHTGVSYGSGLGMSIVKKHVDALGGDIQIKSSEKGTLATVSIPKL